MINENGPQMQTCLLQCQLQMEDLLLSKGDVVRSQIVYVTSHKENWAEFTLNGFKDT